MELSPALKDLIEGLQREIAELRAENAALRAENAALKQEVAYLRRQLDKNSSNSSKPPSSDGFREPPRIAGSLRGAAGKKSGGQIGHKGDTLRPVDKPDKIERRDAAHCAHCAAALTAAMTTGVEKRQVFDLPEPCLEVTEHQARVYTREACHAVTKAAFPEGVNAHVQYGPRVRAAAVYLNTQQLILEDRVGEVMKDLLGAGSLCPASVAAWCAAKAEAFAPVTARIADLLARSPVRNLDETGFRIGQKLQWLHTVSSEVLTHYRVTSRRGEVPEFLEGGVIVHDHFRPYYGLNGLTHALCNAHHLRELKALIDIEKEAWVRKMSRLLVKMAHAVARAVAKGQSVLAERQRRRFEAAYDAILAQGLAFHQAQPPLERRPGARGRQARRPGHNLLERLRAYRSDVLRFLFDFAVPFTNNRAEQDIRMMKLRMKISGGFRANDGAETFATLRSVISTARKRGWNILQTLASPPEAIIAALGPRQPAARPRTSCAVDRAREGGLGDTKKLRPAAI
jgi:transposase